MANQILTTLLRLVEGAVQDKPLRKSVQMVGDAFSLFVNGNKDGWEEISKAAGVPSHAEQVVDEDLGTLACTWSSLADEIFGEGGLLSQRLDGYEVREAQVQMARMVQRSIEMRQPAIIEAGTGTGKSFAYAAICMAMGKKVVISTSNKALQMQLYKKDIPFLQTVFPGKQVALVQGKTNYVCRTKVEDAESGTIRLEHPLDEWYLKTETGNTEEIPFAVDWQDLADITVDRYCTGKMCSRYHDCFYYEQKAKRAEADVLITNHMLLALDHLYPGANILPEVDVIVVDEAHKLADYMRNAIGSQFQMGSISRRIELAEKYNVSTSMVEDLKDNFFLAIRRLVGHSIDREIGIKVEIDEGVRLSDGLWELADAVWEDGDMPNTPFEKHQQADADQIRSMADNVLAISQYDSRFVRWIENGDTTGLAVQPIDVSKQIGALAGFKEEKERLLPEYTHCALCGRKLTAETVNVLEGLPYGPDCIRRVDLFGDAEPVALEEWLAMEHATRKRVDRRKPVIFTSATLAAPDMEAFMRECGIPDGLQMIAPSPFDYQQNALLYVPSGSAPGPKDNEYQKFVIRQIRRLVDASKGGAFLLFTSYRAMRYAHMELEYEFEQAGYPVYKQGELNKMEIVKRFAEAGNGVLFATKSFWEGVSIDGEALRLVVIDKLPFEAPSPLNEAREALLVEEARRAGMREDRAKWVPFEKLRLPKMITELKQGTGRLIRTQEDFGVMAILDSRLRTAQYGRRSVIPSLPPAPLTNRLFMVSDFFEERERSGVTFTDLEPVVQFGVLAGHELDNPFGGG